MTVFQVTEIKTKTFYELIIILKYNQVTHCSLLQKKKKKGRKRRILGARDPAGNTAEPVEKIVF